MNRKKVAFLVVAGSAAAVALLLRRRHLRRKRRHEVALENVSSLSCGTTGNLRFSASVEATRRVDELLAEMRKGKALNDLLPQPASVRQLGNGLLPVVIYSDFEPDDLMAAAQIWQLALQRHHPSQGRPVLIFCADFRSKDRGMIFEKKLLMARLMLGLEPYKDFQVVCSSDRAGNQHHPLADSCLAQTEVALDTSAREIASLSGNSQVELYVIAPGHGHLGKLMNKVEKSYPAFWREFQSTARVICYTGSFNTRGTLSQDFDALRQLVKSTPLVDISKFIFFGKGESHPCTQSADTFMSYPLAQWISEHISLLAATISSFNLEFNAHLIAPTNANLFGGRSGADRRSPEQIQRFHTLSQGFEAHGVRWYAKALVEDEELFEKVVPYKQTTVRAFANGSCDMPLCDQVCFLYRWLESERRDNVIDNVSGEWWVDLKSGFTGVGDPDKTGQMGVLAVQPRLVNPQDVALLFSLSEVLEKFLVKHLKLISEASLATPA